MSAAAKLPCDASGWTACAWPIWCDPGQHVLHGERWRRREDGATVCQQHEHVPLPPTQEDSWPAG